MQHYQRKVYFNIEQRKKAFAEISNKTETGSSIPFDLNFKITKVVPMKKKIIKRKKGQKKAWRGAFVQKPSFSHLSQGITTELGYFLTGKTRLQPILISLLQIRTLPSDLKTYFFFFEFPRSHLQIELIKREILNITIRNHLLFMLKLKRQPSISPL